MGQFHTSRAAPREAEIAAQEGPSGGQPDEQPDEAAAPESTGVKPKKKRKRRKKILGKKGAEDDAIEDLHKEIADTVAEKDRELTEDDFMPESEYMRFLLVGHVRYSRGLRGVPVSRIPQITRDPIRLKELFRDLQFRIPTWNSDPLSYCGGQLPKENPYPVFNGTVRKPFPKEWTEFDGDIAKKAPSFLEEIETEIGTAEACRVRVIIEMLGEKRIHPGEALRTFIAIFPNAPHYAIKASRYCPAGYGLEAIVIGLAEQFVAVLISPARITYYCNVGVMTFDIPIFYKQMRKPRGAEMNAPFHIRTVPLLFSTWAGWQAEYVTIYGTENLMIDGRGYSLDGNTRNVDAPKFGQDKDEALPRHSELEDTQNVSRPGNLCRRASGAVERQAEMEEEDEAIIAYLIDIFGNSYTEPVPNASSTAQKVPMPEKLREEIIKMMLGESISPDDARRKTTWLKALLKDKAARPCPKHAVENHECVFDSALDSFSLSAGELHMDEMPSECLQRPALHLLQLLPPADGAEQWQKDFYHTLTQADWSHHRCPKTLSGSAATDTLRNKTGMIANDAPILTDEYSGAKRAGETVPQVRDGRVVTAYGIHGIDSDGKEIISPGEWLGIEGSGVWRKMLRERGIIGKISQDPPGPGWELVKKKAPAPTEPPSSDIGTAVEEFSRSYEASLHTSLTNPDHPAGALIANKLNTLELFSSPEYIPFGHVITEEPGMLIPVASSTASTDVPAGTRPPEGGSDDQ